ncbi:MAG: hypothetical protein OXI15_04840, partial [Chromatiales bacterium]|nr:hypothetical protein [Chromatiales bacterium]
GRIGSTTAAAPEPAGTEPSGGGRTPGPEAEDVRSGFFARIVEWFRSDSAQAHPSPSASEREVTGAGVTLGDVHRAIADLIAEVELLRRVTGVSAAPREAAPRPGPMPVHIHVKTLEVLEKTARVQRRLGMIPVETQHPDVTGLSPQGLHRAVREAIGELHRIKRQLVVEEAVEAAPPSGAGTPSALYRDLAHASSLLDGLVGRPATLGDVRVRIAQAHVALRPIAVRLGIAPGAEPPPVTGTAGVPREVAQQVLRATYKAIGLQTALGMEASGVPAATLEGAGEAEALETANFLLAEVLRIQEHLGIESAPEMGASSRDEPPVDAFAQALRIVAHLDAMIRVARHAG